MTFRRHILLIALVLAGAVYGAVRPRSFWLNDRTYAGDIAPPFITLPTPSPEDHELVRSPTTNDFLGYIAAGVTVTCHVVNGTMLECSNGFETDVRTQTVQQVFQIMAEQHAILHTPQTSPLPPLVEHTGTLDINDQGSSHLTIESKVHLFDDETGTDPNMP